VDEWYDRSAGAGIEPKISYGPSRYATELFRRQKARIRLERWWHGPIEDARQAAPSREKLAEAKRQRFATEGKYERVSRSLSALSQPSRIQLPPEQWRQIVEDPDLEEQFS